MSTPHSTSSASDQEPDPRSATMLYKILTPSDYRAMSDQEGQIWYGASIDLTDKFIHLSTSTQLSRTLQRFFSCESGVGDTLWISGIPTLHLQQQQQQQEEDDGSATGETKLLWEEAAGSLFAHVYGGMRPSRDFTLHEEIKRDPSSGQFLLPKLQF